ncbi:MAG: peptidoglycan-binding domain-containing protein [Nostocaceae cyanobacterium]|nr:peptidoglycan-binding domain-containing protein [Nostocaceae cyanobacterium]
MSDISLFIAGMLVKEQTSAPNSLYNSGIALKKGVQNSKPKCNQLSDLVPSFEIIPPEFIESNKNYQANSSVLAVKNKSLLNNITSRLYQKVSSSLMESKYSLPGGKDSLSSCTVSRENKDLKQGGEQILIAKLGNFTDNTLPTLRFGESGLSVRVLQRLLLSNGYAIGGVDGVFGAMTETAVKAFQSQRNVVEDGIVGEITWRELTRE